MTDNVIRVTMPKEATKDLPALLDAVDKESPDREALSALCEYFIANPTVCDALGNLAEMTTNNLVVRSFPTRSTGLAIYTRLTMMRDNLGYNDASELEKSLIQHVVLCWLRLHDCELKYHMVTGDNPTMSQGAYWEKKLSYNQRRFLKASETLARVRRLMAKAEPKPDRTAFNLLLAQQIGGKRGK